MNGDATFEAQLFRISITALLLGAVAGVLLAYVTTRSPD